MRRKRKKTSGAVKAAAPAGAAGLAATAVWRFVQRKRNAAGATAPENAPSAVRDWTCECGQRFRVSGEDRHRGYWLEDADDADPVLGDQCPSCEKPLSQQEAVA